jgi:ADP-ribosylglycohydrolase
MHDLEDKFVGSMLGLALGDALGAPHEGGPIARTAWWALGVGKGGVLRWTDDTEMAVWLARSLIENRGLDPDHLARTWAGEADWKRGYGSGARRLGTGIEAHRLSVTAVYAAARFAEFRPMIEFIISMAGGIFGARHGAGALPAEALEDLEERPWIEGIARKLFATADG